MDVVILNNVRVDVQVSRRILGPLSLRIGAGEHWVLVGPNGSGKTTTLSVVGAWQHPSSGRVEILGHELGRVDVRQLRTRIGHVSHAVADRLRPELSVERVVLSGRSSTLEVWMQEFARGDEEEAVARLEQVGCDGLAAQAFGLCSQGERQRVLIARALFGRKNLLLLDEPTAGLDLPGREALMSAVGAAARDPDGPTIIMATHRLEEVPPSTTHAALLRGGMLVAGGPVRSVFTDEALSRCFGIDISVRRHDGRWAVFSRAARS